MRLIRWAVIALLPALLFVVGAGRVGAQQGTQTGGVETFTLAPGATATITFTAFCTEFGVDFPESVEAPSALAEQSIRNALAYIQSEGLDDAANAEEVQYAIWQLSGATDSPQGGQIAADVVAAAETALEEPAEGTSLLDAVTAGQVEVTLDSWEALGEPIQIGEVTDNFYGQGTLTVTNTSDEELTLYHPVGALFAPAAAGEQTMAGYATEIEVEEAAGGAAQATTTATAAATATTVATTAPTTAATTAATTATATAADGTPNALPQTAGESSFPWWALIVAAAFAMIGAGWLTARGTRS